MSSRSRPRSASAVSRISRSPLRNTSTSPSRLSRSSSSTASPIASGWSRSGPSVGQRQRPVAHLDREGAAAHLDDRRVAEVLGELPGVDRRRGDDQLEVGPLGQQLVQEAEQEVDVQRALVGLVDDDGVVAAQQPVVLDLGQQQAVGDQPHQRALAGAVVEAHGVADRLAEVDVELVGDPLGDRARGQPPRLRVGDRAADPAAQLQADLGQLRGLARAGLAGDDDDLVVADRRQQVVAARADRQRRRIGDLRDRVAAACIRCCRRREVAIQPRQRGLVLGMAVRALQPPAEPVLVDQRQLLQAGSELGERHAREDRRERLAGRRLAGARLRVARPSGGVREAGRAAGPAIDAPHRRSSTPARSTARCWHVNGCWSRAARPRWRRSSSSSASRPRTSRRRTSSSGRGWPTSTRRSCRRCSKAARRSGSCSCAGRSTSSPRATRCCCARSWTR